QGLATTPNANAVLANDIDASGTSGGNGGAGFEPVGAGLNPYTGAFDGDGHFILNLTINRPAQSLGGVFGIRRTASGSNLRLENVNVEGDHQVGGLIAWASFTTIDNVAVSGSVVANGEIVGGLVADLLDFNQLTNSYSTASVTGNLIVGGLVGYMSESA